MAADCELYDPTLTTIEPDSISLGDLVENQSVLIRSVKVQNDGDSASSFTRYFCRCFNGLYTGQSNEAGQEIVTLQALEITVGGSPLQPIGGDFAGGSNPSPAGNYYDIGALAAGAATAQIDIYLNLPSGMSSAGRISFQQGVSFQP